MKLFRISLLITIALLIAFPGWAQDNSITFSATGIYNGALPKTPSGALGILKSHEIVPGGQVDLSSKLAGPIHLAMQFDYSQKPDNILVSFTGGPEFDLGKNFFVHALVGGVHLSQKPPKVQALGDSAFIYTVGGGFRVPLSKRVFFSLGADYNYSEMLKSSDSLWKAAAGIGFRWGK
jgi:hypothetical protein